MLTVILRAGTRQYGSAAAAATARKNGAQKWRFAALAGGLGVGGATALFYSIKAQHDPERVLALESAGPRGSQRLQESEPVTLLSYEEVDRRLKARQASYLVNNGTGISRYDISQLPSNNPIEDNHSEQVLKLNSDKDLYFFGIYDGHGGPYTSSKLSQVLIPHVARDIIKCKGSEQTSQAIMDSFVRLDDEIVTQSFRNLFNDPLSRDNIKNIMPAVSGACALLSVYDSQSKELKVAVTGDSRALLVGRGSHREEHNNDDDDGWYVKACSVDQTGDNLDEVARIRKEHPKEPNVIARGRVLGGLQPSRAFGDYRYKLKEVDGKPLDSLPDYLKLYLRNFPKNFLSPPYVTARPEVTTTKVNTMRDKLLIMGSDGLFELLSNEEIASLAIKWLETREKINVNGALPKVKDISTDNESQRPAFRYQNNRSNDGRGYLMEDTNLATHIIRNALSAGGRKEFLSTLMSIPSPTSRKYRDDLTVTVVFFGGDGESARSDATLTINESATTPLQPKL